MKYVIVNFTTLLVLLVLGFAALFGQSNMSQIHDSYIRSFSTSIAILHNSHSSGGTGFIIRGKSGAKYLVTNAHVCGLAEDGKIFVDYNDDKYQLNVIKKYPLNDLCAVEAPTHSKPLVLAGSVYLGEKVHVLGHPLLEKVSHTEGEISGNTQISVMVAQNVEPKDCSGPTYTLEPAPPFMQIFGVNNACIRTLEAFASTTPILPGNSGSPVLNDYGHVVAVAFASAREGVRSYFVGLDFLKDFLSSL